VPVFLPPLANLLAQAHRDHDVALHCGVELADALRDGGKVRLTCAKGGDFTGDLVVYGIGVTLNDELAAAAGLAMDDGILVDAQGRTSHPAIYAAGDIARQEHAFICGMVRQETWANALHQGGLAGRAMVTGQTGAQEVPWYWTDQFGVNYQVAGRTSARHWITRREDGRPRLIFGLEDGVLTGAVGIDAGADMRAARRMIEQGLRPDPAVLADPSVAVRKIGHAAHMV
ncbi:FAD-dependent oxidoreductase, partial [Novosphingobium sp. SCN 63-17]|uniref:FAD-dependent oxidoreductase n=1 Tax=Novosphingobium sp. SCN 63-17 TaxID=1660120 RepID=UPI0025DC7E86